MLSSPRGHDWVDETQPEQREAGNTYRRCSRCSLVLRATVECVQRRTILDDEDGGDHMHVITYARIIRTPDGELALSELTNPMEGLVCRG